MAVYRPGVDDCGLMVLRAIASGRATLLFLAVFALLSTGVASSTVLEADSVAGHTSYLSAIVELPDGPGQEKSPITYGLATLRVDYVLGLVSKSRPMAESTDQMVFAWAADAPDPRKDPTLRPTGELAQIHDRLGARWLVHELVYQGADPEGTTYYAYAVFLGPVRQLEDGSSYNHVLTYRADRLVAPLQQDAGEPAEAADPDVPSEPGSQTLIARGVLEEEPERQTYLLDTGVGPRPDGIRLSGPL